MIVSPALMTVSDSPCLFHPARRGQRRALYASLNCGFGSGDLAGKGRAQPRHRDGSCSGSRPTGSRPAARCTAPSPLPSNSPGGVEDAPRADAMATDVPGMALGVLAADCAPVLLCDPVARVIGAAHAGWRGAFGGVVEATVGGDGTPRRAAASISAPASARASAALPTRSVLNSRTRSLPQRPHGGEVLCGRHRAPGISCSTWPAMSSIASLAAGCRGGVRRLRHRRRRGAVFQLSPRLAARASRPSASGCRRSSSTAEGGAWRIATIRPPRCRYLILFLAFCRLGRARRPAFCWCNECGSRVPAMAASAVLLMAACQPLPHPFANDVPKPGSPMLTLRDTATVAVAPLEGGPRATAKKLAPAMAEALQKHDIAASDRTIEHRQLSARREDPGDAGGGRQGRDHRVRGTCATRRANRSATAPSGSRRRPTTGSGARMTRSPVSPTAAPTRSPRCCKVRRRSRPPKKGEPRLSVGDVKGRSRRRRNGARKRHRSTCSKNRTSRL